jgi:diaminopropionate ammonia-lyase
MDLVRNCLADRSAPYLAKAKAVISRRRSDRAQRALAACPLHSETPMRAFDRLARGLGVAAIYVKDETHRLGLSSFKALGGAYAVTCQRKQLGEERPLVFVTATDGNHGISVAAGARVAGGRAVIYLPRHVEAVYEQTMRALGADIVRTGGTYDDAVMAAGYAATQNGWTLVADTTNSTSDPVTRDVMDGYGILLEECIGQLEAAGLNLYRGDLTHLFVQGGVGGLAAAMAGGFWQRLGARRPTVVVVEPRRADCLFQSARAGAPAGASGDLETSMGMLSCGLPSRMAWTILKTAADFFMVIDDRTAAVGARAFAAGMNDAGHTTPSGGAGLAGLIRAAQDGELRAALGLDETSVVLTVCTEGRPDPVAAAAAFEQLAARGPKQR